MNTELAAQSRVWIYQSAQPFSEQQKALIEKELQGFVSQWVSHNRQLKSSSLVLHDRFLVLMVDETNAGASGCSIDSSVRFLQNLEARYQVQLFDRMRFSYRDKNGAVQTVSNTDFSQLYAQGVINDDTPVFDTLVKTKTDFDQSFEKPLKESWHRRMVG